MNEHEMPAVGVPTCYRHPGRETYIRCQRCERPICPDCMRDASVGFQCPECVAEGARSTRSGRTAYGGLRPGNAAVTSMVLIALNVAVWLAVLATGRNGSALVDQLGLRDRGLCLLDGGAFDVAHRTCSAQAGTRWLPGVSDGAYWQLLTSVFTHVEVWHIAFNMLALWVLGPQLELAVGRVRFLALYLLSGLSGSLLVYWLAPAGLLTLGASGAIFGLMGALLVLALKVRGQLQQILVWIGINFAITVSVPHVSWQGHLGGFLGGALVAAALVYAPRSRRTLWQSAGLGAILVLLLAGILVRTAALS
jgi:membrane associated rhomboid family serine protease